MEINNFDKEIELTRQNQELIKFLEDRSSKTNTLTFSQVKKQLNL